MANLEHLIVFCAIFSLHDPVFSHPVERTTMLPIPDFETESPIFLENQGNVPVYTMTVPMIYEINMTELMILLTKYGKFLDGNKTGCDGGSYSNHAPCDFLAQTKNGTISMQTFLDTEAGSYPQRKSNHINKSDEQKVWDLHSPLPKQWAFSGSSHDWNMKINLLKGELRRIGLRARNLKFTDSIFPAFLYDMNRWLAPSASGSDVQFNNVNDDLLLEQKDQTYQLGRIIAEMEKSISKCRSQQIPINIIGHTEFDGRLEEYKAVLNKLGYTMSMDTTRSSTYMNLELADCFFSEETVRIVIHIPVTSRRQQWTISKVINPSYVFQDQVCRLEIGEGFLVARSESDIQKIIGGDYLNHCRIDEGELCFIPPIAVQSYDDDACAPKLLLQGENALDNFTNICRFECKSSAEVDVFRTENGEILITNAKRINVMCKGQGMKSYLPSRAGHVNIGTNHSCVVRVQDEHANYTLDPNNNNNITAIWSDFPKLVNRVPWFLLKPNISSAMNSAQNADNEDATMEVIMYMVAVIVATILIISAISCWRYCRKRRDANVHKNKIIL